MAINQTQLNQIYRDTLGRDADPGASGYLRWGDVNAIKADIMKSPEYAARRSAPAAAPASNPLQDFAAQQKAASDALLNRQKQEQEGLFTNYEGIRKSQEALPALYNRLQTEAGIPELSNQAQTFKNEIYKTKDKLDRLSEDVTARTTGYNVSEAQRRRLEAAESEPLATNLGRLGTGLAPIADMLSSAQSSVSTRLGLETQQQERDLEPIKMRINSISDRFARELTGFNADRELQLTAVLDKLERDRVLSDREWALAQELAAEERSYARQKASAATALTRNYAGGASTQPAPVSTPKPVPVLPNIQVPSYLAPLAPNSGNKPSYLAPFATQPQPQSLGASILTSRLVR